MFKKTGLAALLLLLAILVTSCGDKEGPGTETTPGGATQEQTNAQGETLDVPNVMYDETIRVYVKGGEYADEIYPEARDGGAERVKEQVVRRNTTLLELYGIEFEYTQSLNAFNTDALTLLRGGEDVYDIMQCHGRSAYSYAGEGLVLDWNTLPNLSLEKSWWNQSAREYLTICGVLPAMTGEIGYSSLGGGTGVVFNKTVFQDAGISADTVYGLVDSGDWTFDAMYGYATQLTGDLNGDGNITNTDDRIGFTTTWWSAPIQVLYSTGSTVIAFDEAGKPGFNFYNADVIDAFDKLLDLLNSDYGYCYNEDDPSNNRRAFSQNQAAMMSTAMQALGTSFFLNSEVDFGVLPYPKYDSDVEKYYSVVDAASALYVVPRTVPTERREMVGAVLESLAYYGQKYLMPEYYGYLLTSRYLKDDVSARMLDYVYEGCTYDLGYYNTDEFGGSYASIGYELVKNPGQTFTNYYRQYYAAMDQKLDDAYAKYQGLAAGQNAADSGAA